MAANWLATISAAVAGRVNRRTVPEFHRLGVGQDGEQCPGIPGRKRFQPQLFRLENHAAIMRRGPHDRGLEKL